MSFQHSGPLTERSDPTQTKLREGDWRPLTIRDSASPHAITRIRQSKSEVEARGGNLILPIPWVYGGDVNDEQTLNSVQRTVNDLSKIAPLLVDQKMLNIQNEPELFADTRYHLKPEGREVRSEQLVRQLKSLSDETQ